MNSNTTGNMLYGVRVNGPEQQQPAAQPAAPAVPAAPPAPSMQDTSMQNQANLASQYYNPATASVDFNALVNAIKQQAGTPVAPPPLPTLTPPAPSSWMPGPMLSPMRQALNRRPAPAPVQGPSALMPLKR